MKFTISAKQMEVADDLRKYTEKKVGKIDRLFRSESEAFVTFSRERGRFTAEVTLKNNGMFYRVSDTTSDIFASVDSACASIERQIRKNKTRLEKKLKSGPIDWGSMSASPDEPEEEEEFKIVRTKRFSLKPMTPEEVKAAILEELAMLRTYSDIGDGTVTIEETEDVDWINNWKQYFHQFWIDDILAIPSWEEPEITDKKPALVFHIDPGTAFGTGMHETTQLCIRQIRKYLTPETVMLDVGTGSGILAILALMFGIKSAVGTDLDPCAPPAIEDNLKTNGVDPSKLEVILGNLIDDPKVQAKVGTERYDIVAANILADVLIPLTPHVVPTMKPGAYYITSGILEGREDSVAEAMRQAGLEVVSVTAQGEWRCVVGRKPLA